MTQSSNYSGLFKANCKDSGPDPKATDIRGRISTNLKRLQIKASACLSFCTSTWALQNSSGPTALVLGKGTRSCQEFEYPLGVRAALPSSAGQDAKPAVTCCLQPAALSPAATGLSSSLREEAPALGDKAAPPLSSALDVEVPATPRLLGPLWLFICQHSHCFGGSQSSEVYQAQLTGPYSKCNHSRWLSSPLLVWFLFFFFAMDIFPR